MGINTKVRCCGACGYFPHQRLVHPWAWVFVLHEDKDGAHTMALIFSCNRTLYVIFPQGKPYVVGIMLGHSIHFYNLQICAP